VGGSIENPEHSFADFVRRDWLVTTTTSRDMLFRKVFPYALPLFVA
jgi:hypothetical protein